MSIDLLMDKKKVPVTILMSPCLRDRLKEVAAADRRSMSNWIVLTLELAASYGPTSTKELI
jgi:hypothetical protein